MAIVARYTPKNILVNVVDVLTTGDGRKRVAIRAIEGEPFEVNSHGGPMNTACAIVSPDLLSDIKRGPKVFVHGNGHQVQQQPAGEQQPIEAARAFFPSRYNSERQPWKGINSD